MFLVTRIPGRQLFLRHATNEVAHRALTWTSGLALYRCSGQSRAPFALISELISSQSRDDRFKEAFKADRFDSSGAGQ